MTMHAATARVSGPMRSREGRRRYPVSVNPIRLDGMQAVVSYIPLRTFTPVFDTREALAYIAHPTTHCHPVSEPERQAILAYAEAWGGSAEIRAEFGTFSTFASYMRGRRAGKMERAIR